MDIILKKMHVKSGMRLAFVDLDGILKPYLDAQTTAVIVEDDADVVMGLVLAMKDVDACVEQMKAKRKPGSNLWMVYPKAKKGFKPDVNRDILFAYTQDRHQLIANGNIALDEDYSMLRFKDLI